MQQQKRIGVGGIIVLALASFWLIGRFSGDSGNDSQSSFTSSPPAENRPGSPVVYARIGRLTNCAALQEQFDIAADNADRRQDAGQLAPVEISYMDAADDRMREVGCYG